MTTAIFMGNTKRAVNYWQCNLTTNSANICSTTFLKNHLDKLPKYYYIRPCVISKTSAQYFRPTSSTSLKPVQTTEAKQYFSCPTHAALHHRFSQFGCDDHFEKHGKGLDPRHFQYPTMWQALNRCLCFVDRHAGHK